MYNMEERLNYRGQGNVNVQFLIYFDRARNTIHLRDLYVTGCRSVTNAIELLQDYILHQYGLKHGTYNNYQWILYNPAEDFASVFYRDAHDFKFLPYSDSRVYSGFALPRTR